MFDTFAYLHCAFSLMGFKTVADDKLVYVYF